MHTFSLSHLETTADNRGDAEAISSGQRPHVCLIEHVTATRQSLETFLIQEGFIVETFACGIEALRSFAHADRKLPDILLLDIDGPGMNGYGLLRYFKDMPSSAQTHVVVLSRFDGIMERLLSRLAGASCYLVKPFSAQMILRVLYTLSAQLT